MGVSWKILFYHNDFFTKISFKMSKEIFGDLTFDINDFQSRINILKEKLKI
jgi:hypothetical protein